MKFQIESQEGDYPIIEVIQALQVADFILEVKFSDGKTNLIDFKEFLISASHPEIRKYLNQDLFGTFVVKDGNVIWNDYDLIFPISDLYKGKIS